MEDSRFFFFEKRDYSLLNETAQFNSLEFMGLTVGEDYVSGSSGGKKLPGGPTFTGNCYYRCRDVLLAMRELARAEIQIVAGSLTGRSGGSQGPLLLMGV